MENMSEQKVNHHEISMATIKERAEKLKAEYANTSINMPPLIKSPVKQLKNNPSLRTCLVATCINAMEALGYPNPPTEKEVLKKLMRIESPTEIGELRAKTVLDYLKSQGFKVRPIWGHPKDLIEGLLEGGCAIQIIPSKNAPSRSHATLLAGVKINKGNIRLTEFNPSPGEAEKKEYSLKEHINRLYQPDAPTSLSLITR